MHVSREPLLTGTSTLSAALVTGLLTVVGAPVDPLTPIRLGCGYLARLAGTTST
jgi:hypothetical protein